MNQDTYPAVQVATAPTVLPMSLDEAKDHCRIAQSETGHDTRLTRLIKQARNTFESDTSLITINTTFTQTQRHFEDEVFLTYRNPSSITTVKYYDTSNVQQTVSSAVYQLDIARRLVVQKPDQYWPTGYKDRWDCVEVKYVAGAGASESSVPDDWKQALALLIQYYFDNDDWYLKAYESFILRKINPIYP